METCCMCDSVLPPGVLRIGQGPSLRLPAGLPSHAHHTPALVAQRCTVHHKITQNQVGIMAQQARMMKKRKQATNHMNQPRNQRQHKLCVDLHEVPRDIPGRPRRTPVGRRGLSGNDQWPALIDMASQGISTPRKVRHP